jgi:ectoine hydroxylase-related dioxygenase (phytanoyl-CoA dioxygenase family)
MQSNNTTLSKQQIESFFEEGFLIIPNLFNQAELTTILNKANSLKAEAIELAKHHSGKVMSRGTQFVVNKIQNKVQINRIVWAGAAEPDLLTVSRQAKLLLPVSQLLGSDEADHLTNQFHYKLPHDRVEFWWHQDVHHRINYENNWRDVNGKGSFVQVLIAIEPMTLDNGPIFMVPKSVKYGAISQDVFQAKLTKILVKDKAIPLLLNPGDVALMHPYLIHGSFPNESEESRILFINGFSYPGANTKKYVDINNAERISLVEIFENSTSVGNLRVHSLLDSSCTKMYNPDLRYESPSTNLTEASFEKSIINESFCEYSINQSEGQSMVGCDFFVNI